MATSRLASVSMSTTGRQYLRRRRNSEPYIIPGAPFCLEFNSYAEKVLPGEGEGGLEINLEFVGAVAITMSSPEGQQSPYLFVSRHDPIHSRTFQFEPSLHFSSINASHEAIAAILIQIRPILSEDHHKALTSEIAEFAYELVETARAEGLLDIRIYVDIKYMKTGVRDDEIESTIEQYRCFKAAVSLHQETDRKLLQGSCLLQLTEEEFDRPSDELFEYLCRTKSSGTCAVCLDEIGTEWMQAVELLCNHRFHTDCMRVWLKRKKSCPLCRSDLSTPKFPDEDT